MVLVQPSPNLMSQTFGLEPSYRWLRHDELSIRQADHLASACKPVIGLHSHFSRAEGNLRELHDSLSHAGISQSSASVRSGSIQVSMTCAFAQTLRRPEWWRRVRVYAGNCPVSSVTPKSLEPA